MIPYGHQSIDEDDIQAVIDVLRSDWLTTGPKVEEFEKSVAQFVGSAFGIAVNSGTAALHCAMNAIGITRGDEVIIPAITFAATANSVLYEGGTPVFADLNPDTLLIDTEDVERKITPRTKAVIAVDFAGQSCDYDHLKDICNHHNLHLVSDACHSLGGRYKNRNVGSLADLTVFSFHPVKSITTGEGGMITTDNPAFAQKMYSFRNHGIDTPFIKRNRRCTWEYEINDLGCNYRLGDIQCALGISQLRKLPGFVNRRQNIARKYDTIFDEIPTAKPLLRGEDISHAYHLYVIQLDLDKLGVSRSDVFLNLHSRGVGVNVHYIPVYRHPLYKERLDVRDVCCPVADNAYERILSLPIFPELKEDDFNYCIATLIDVLTDE